MHIGTCKSFSLSFGLSIFFFSQQHNINIFWEVKKKTQRKEREKSNGCNRDVRKRKVKRFCLLYDWKKNERDNSRWMKEVKKYGHTKQFAVSSMFSLIWFFFVFLLFAFWTVDASELHFTMRRSMKRRKRRKKNEKKRSKRRQFDTFAYFIAFIYEIDYFLYLRSMDRKVEKKSQVKKHGLIS